jgi:hypothetical protein
MLELARFQRWYHTQAERWGLPFVVGSIAVWVAIVSTPFLLIEPTGTHTIVGMIFVLLAVVLPITIINANLQEYRNKLVEMEAENGDVVEEPPAPTAEPFATVPLPPSFTLDKRFRHQWVLGAHGSGKTTLLSHMILNDLQLVAENKASVFVMDSQNELIPQLAQLRLFAPGQPLEGKLIYLDPEPEFPLALNIFDLDSERLSAARPKDRAILERGAFDMVEFFLSAILKMDVSSHQEVMLKYLVPAVMAVPNATILTLRDLVDDGGYQKYVSHFGALDPEVQQWLKSRLHDKEYSVTRTAIKVRIDGFLADSLFRQMFRSPRNRFDLFEAMQSSKVILINTNKALLKGNTEAFGRFFIAKLLQATEERMLLTKGDRLPVFAYIDEATDYIADEKNIAELIDRARKQRVALILAHQREEQIKSPNVFDALRHVGIKCTPYTFPYWIAQVGSDAPIELKVPPTDFGAMPRMDLKDWALMIQHMHDTFGIETAAPVQALQATEPPQKPDDGDTDAKDWPKQ